VPDPPADERDGKPSAVPTVALVARHAGVSVASVSRVLNGLPSSPVMAARVHAAAQELGYVPDAVARSLKVGRTEQLAFAVADVGNPVYVAMMRAVEDVVRSAGYRLVISSMGSDAKEEIGIVNNLNRGYADGLILSPLRITDDLLEALRSTRVPVVVVGTLPADVPIDNVRADSPRGVGLAMRHLYDAGRRRIGFVNGPADTVPGSARAEGFARAVRRLGLAPDPALRVDAADFTFSCGQDAAHELLDRARPDAVLAANDLLAVGTLDALRSRGLRVPDDVAVVGMDDTELAGMATPTLTSVYLGSAERGRLAAEMLLDRIAQPGLAPRSVRVAPRLVIRASSGGDGVRS
jgi:LacI family transcriptional regulator